MQVGEPDGDYRREEDQEIHRVPLSGCAPVPLASYLKALGVLRLVAEQVDPEARGYWQDERFVLESRLDGDRLRSFFLEDYRPTPILAPWNGGSGFFPKDNQSGIKPIEESSAARLDSIRAAISTSRSVLHRQGLHAKPNAETEKRWLLSELRSELDDAAINWLDAAILLTEESPKYPPLLGTGGNDGRLEFTNNFLQRLVAVIDPETGESNSGAAKLLGGALYAEQHPGLPTDKIGQFAPGDAGGPNQTAGFEADALVNPWDFILMLEGALLFAASAARRLESTEPGALSYPFTVWPTGAGFGGAAMGDEESARKEIWVPLWSMPTALAELKVFLAEGRATIGRRPVRDGLDFVRAISRLGVDRGISAFQRYAFLRRSGKAFFATPLNRVVAARNPSADLVDELDADSWLGRFRRFARQEGLNRAVSLARRLEDTVFRLSVSHADQMPQIQQLLTLLGEIQLYFARSPKAREACPPVPSLSPQWLTRADDGSGELSLAAALAGLHGRVSSLSGDDGGWTLPMRMHLAPERAGRRLTWDENAAH